MELCHTLRERNACADFLAIHGPCQDEPLVSISISLVGMSPLLLANAIGVSFVGQEAYCRE